MEASPTPRPSSDAAGALELLRGGRRFLLTGHSQPDGDCLGSQVALAAILRSLGKEVFTVNPDPVAVHYDFLGEANRAATFGGGALPAHDVAVLLDFSELSRVAEMAAPLAAAPSRKLVIDHHVYPGEPWWDAAVLDPTAAATGLIVHRIGLALGVPLERGAALGVFTALVTDTGWFRYPNTDAEVLRVAAECVALGIEPAAVHRALHQRKSRRHPMALGRLLAGVEYHAGGRLAVATLPHDADSAVTDGDEALDILRSVGTVEVVLLLRELSDGSAKLSARAKTWFDVEAVARIFGGGGHRRAAGAHLPGPLAEAREQLVRAVLERLEAEPSRRGAGSSSRGGARA